MTLALDLVRLTTASVFCIVGQHEANDLRGSIAFVASSPLLPGRCSSSSET